MRTDLHLETRGGSNGICGEKDPSARVTTAPEIVTCEACRRTKSFATRVRYHAQQRARDQKKREVRDAH